MEQFYIDRAFGIPIWIDVKNGIVQECYNETEMFTSKMNAKYVGKSITFLKEDFIDRALKGVYASLHAHTLTILKLQITSFETRIRQLWNEYSSLEVTKDRQMEIKGQVKELEPQQFSLEKDLVTEKQRILTEHNFLS